MKKIVLCILCIFCIKSVYAHEQEKQSHHVHELRGYGLVGLTAAPAIALDLGLGFRFQYGHVGLDVVYDNAALFAKANVWHYHYSNRRPAMSEIFSRHVSSKITPSLLIYPHPNLASEWYVGLGTEFGFITRYPYSAFHFFAPEYIVGKKYINAAGKKDSLNLE